MKYMSPWIFTTNQCNLRCPYCYVKWNDKKMSRQTYDKINSRFLHMLDTGELDFVVYRLAGGEPTLVFHDWKEFVQEFLNKCGSKGFVSIITNLTILTDEMLEFFTKYKDKIGFGISLDGYSYSKPFINGKSSAEIVKANVDKLLKIGINNIDISTVVDEKSFGDVDVLAEWVAKRNLGWGVYLDHFFCGEIDSKIILDKMQEVIDVLSNSGYDIYHRFKFNNIKIDSNYDGCTAGEKLITIDVDGNVFPCQTLVNDDPICNIYTCDNIVQAMKDQKAYKIGYNYTLPEKCKDCSIADICGGGCKMHNKEINKNFTCDIMKAVILYMIKKILYHKGGQNNA
ncbi:MAG: radical SAM protein [Clostridia bacterium]|nr:radical SAM protein [Clostridia bacterium]